MNNIYSTKQILKDMENHVLDLLEEGKYFKLYYLHKEGTIHFSTYIAFSQKAIILFGDLTHLLIMEMSRLWVMMNHGLHLN